MQHTPADIYSRLRDQALGVTAEQLGVSDKVFGVLMETGYPQAVVTLLAMADGSASIYFSTGGGIVGAGQHEQVATFAHSLVTFTAQHLHHFVLAEGAPLPEVGQTCFYALTEDGLFKAAAREAELLEDKHDLSPLFHAAQALIAEIRIANEARREQE